MQRSCIMLMDFARAPKVFSLADFRGVAGAFVLALLLALGTLGGSATASEATRSEWSGGVLDEELPILDAPLPANHWIVASIGARRAEYSQYIQATYPDQAATLICLVEIETAGYWYPAIVNFTDGQTKGLLQFRDGTWARLPAATLGRSIFEGRASIDAGYYLIANGRGFEFATYRWCSEKSDIRTQTSELSDF